MERPQSIAMFERCYLGGWAIGVVNTLLNWSTVSNDPKVVEASAVIGAWYLPTVTAIGLIIPLVLWFFIARQGSVVAKWIMVVLTVIGVGGLAFSAMAGRVPTGLTAVLSLIGIALNVFAATRLFQSDAKSWFGERPADPA